MGNGDARTPANFHLFLGTSGSVDRGRANKIVYDLHIAGPDRGGCGYQDTHTHLHEKLALTRSDANLAE